MIAELAVETHIAPQVLLDLDEEMLLTLLAVLKDRAKAQQKANHRKGSF